jgi:hypothetical protein
MTMNSRQLRAARRDKLMRRYASKAEPMFGVDGRTVPQSEFVEANKHDHDVIEWAATAKVGDSYPAFVPCERVS